MVRDRTELAFLVSDSRTTASGAARSTSTTLPVMRAPKWAASVGASAGRLLAALDWRPNNPCPTHLGRSGTAAQNMRLPIPKRDAWHTYVVHWVAGRTDGSTVRPGSITVWVDGPTRRRSTGRTSTPSSGRKARTASGTRSAGWSSGRGTTRARCPCCDARAGAHPDRRTIGEASPTGRGRRHEPPRPVLRGSGTNDGPPKVTEVTSRMSADARIPPSLGGTGGTAAARRLRRLRLRRRLRRRLRLRLRLLRRPRRRPRSRSRAL